MSALSLILYRRPGCHLCDAAERLVEAEARRLAEPVRLVAVDIESDPELLRRFLIEIPVLADAAGHVRLRAPILRHDVRALLASLADDAAASTCSIPLEVATEMASESKTAPTATDLPRLSARAAGIPGSPTVALDARAKAMLAAGEKVLNLAVGEPDLPPPAPALAAAREHLATATKYAPPTGRPELRRAVALAAERDHGVPTRPDMVLVGVGAKQVLYSLFHVLFDPGDRVLVPSPYWVSYPDQLALAAVEPVIVPTREEDGWRLRAESVAGRIDERTRGIVLNSPNNPTGAVIARDDLRAILELCERHDLWLVSDEIYGVLTYDGQSAAGARTVAKEAGVDQRRVVVVDGASKKFAMTGFRVGWAIAPPDVVEAGARLQSQITSSAASPSQLAVEAALQDDGGSVAAMRATYEARRNRFVAGLNHLGLTTKVPDGAFYAWSSAAPLIGREIAGVPCYSSAQVAARLLESARIACVPGEAFGVPGYLRMSFANPQAVLDEALDRLAEILAGSARAGANTARS